MSFSIEVFNKKNFPIPDNLLFYFHKISEHIIKKFNLPSYKLEIGFVTEIEICKLNKKYKNKNSPTDVLSFSFLDKDNDFFLGTIYFCYPVVKKNNSNILHELCFLFIHSCLHLLGFNHGLEMFKMQEKIMEIFLLYLNFHD